VGAARLREMHPCFRSVLSSISGAVKPKLAKKIIVSVNPAPSLNSLHVNNLLVIKHLAIY
jgi:hypothetical protein